MHTTWPVRHSAACLERLHRSSRATGVQACSTAPVRSWHSRAPHCAVAKRAVLPDKQTPARLHPLPHWGRLQPSFMPADTRRPSIAECAHTALHACHTDPGVPVCRQHGGHGGPGPVHHQERDADRGEERRRAHNQGHEVQRVPRRARGRGAQGRLRPAQARGRCALGFRTLSRAKAAHHRHDSPAHAACAARP